MLKYKASYWLVGDCENWMAIDIRNKGSALKTTSMMNLLSLLLIYYYYFNVLLLFKLNENNSSYIYDENDQGILHRYAKHIQYFSSFLTM